MMKKILPLPSFTSPREKSYHIPTFFGGLNMDSDSQLLENNESPLAYNVDITNGALSRCGGYGPARWYNTLDPSVPLYTSAMPAPIRQIFIYREQEEASASDHVLVQLTDHRLYRYSALPDYGVVAYNELSFSQPWPEKELTFLVNYRYNGLDKAILGGREAGMFVYRTGQALAAVSGAPWLSKGVLHYGRLFGVGNPDYPQRIWFSAPGNPENFTVALDQGGYIDVLGDKGSAQNIVVFQDHLYIFWQYGITRLTAYAQQSEFTVSDIYSCDSEILPESICVCGRQILFASRDGIYSFSGGAVSCISRRIRLLFADMDTEGSPCAFFYRSRYYLSLRLPEEEITGNNAMVEYDTLRDSWRLFKGCTLRHLAVIHDTEDEKLLAAAEADERLLCWDGSDSFGGGQIDARWDSPTSDLGAANYIKEMRELHLAVSGSGGLRITLRADGQEQVRTVALTESRRMVKLPFSLRGHLMSLSIENTEGCAFTAVGPLLLFTLERS